MKLADVESKVSVMEAQLRASKSKAIATDARAKAIEEQASYVGTRVVEEFRGSKAFEDEVAKGSLDAFKLGFAK